MVQTWKIHHLWTWWYLPDFYIDSTTWTSCMQGDESPGSDSDVFPTSSKRTLQKTTTAVVSFLKKIPCHQNQLTFSPRKINIEIEPE